jgi:hypothetical protein
MHKNATKCNETLSKWCKNKHGASKLWICWRRIRITPEPIRDEWEMRARNWFLAHGGSYDELTGDLICSDGLRIPRENWKKIVKEIKEGKRKFTPDREKDLLTLVLGNDNHGGRMMRADNHPVGNPKRKV